MSSVDVNDSLDAAAPRRDGRSGAIGKPIDRVDGRQKITGAARYAAEFRRDRLTHAVMVQSTIAKGRILAIDAAAAKRAPGVIAVLTHQNTPKFKTAPQGQKADPLQSGKMGEDRLPFSDDVIHYAGQHVALVVADTLDHARHAASLVKVRYREEKPVLTMEEAEPDAYMPKASFGRPLQHERGNVEAALAAPGAVKVRQTYTIPVLTNNPMEPSATVAVWDGGKLTVADATQAVMGTRGILAQAFGIPKEDIRVVCPYTGGGFGCKGFSWSHTMLTAMAAKVVKRPVQLNLTRQQMFTSVGHRPPTRQTISLAATRDGKLTAIKHETLQPTSTTTEFVEPCGLTTSKMIYSCENVAVPHHLVKVNVGPPTPMRAPGDCPGSFAIESAMDELAYELGMDPIDLRLRNYAEMDEGEKKPWSSKHLKECYQRGAEIFGWKKRDPRPGSMKDGDLLVGWGMATALYPGNRRPASAKARLTPDGRALVQACTQDLGTGSYTVFTQVAADALGLPVDRVTFELGDSELPPAPGSGGSNSAASVSEAVYQVGGAIKTKLAAIATSDPESPLAGLRNDQLVLVDGRLALASDPSRGIAIADLVKRSRMPAVEAEVQVKPEDEKTKKYSIHSWGAQLCEVKIDPLLPRVQVSRWVSVIDVGRVLNLKLSRSQVMGGVTMGIGMALMEHTVYDPKTGRPLTDNFADYLIPVNADFGAFEVELLSHPDPVINTLGCRGIGEIGITGVAAAIANAVYHATGKRVRDLPITIDKLVELT
jgi:xanthine dehydrogenase YagR molybdenum-binding subunit